MNEGRRPSLVSVIIPTYNRADLLPETMDSVLAQSYRPIEVVVVDDGSADNTQEVLQTWSIGCPGKGEFEVRYFYQPNRGPSSARNLGFAESKGEFVLYLDSDDLLLPEKLDLQTKELDTRYDACVSGAKWMDANGRVFFEDIPPESPSADPLDDYLQCKTRPWPEVWLFRRSLLESGLSWDTSLFGPEDSLYVFEVLVSCPRNTLT
jgi:glycosyltransferase involved in cell wall biosynthesis